MTLLAEQIKSAALDMGYEKCGIINISQLEDMRKNSMKELIVFQKLKAFTKVCIVLQI